MARIFAMITAATAVVVAALVIGVGGGGTPTPSSTRSSTPSSTPTPAPSVPTTAEPVRPALPMLVLYDTSGEWSSVGEADSILSANLLGRFGPVTRLPVQQYTAGLAAAFGGVLYVGTTFDEPLPTAFLDDVVAGATPVVWAGLNIWQLGDRLTTAGCGFVPGLLEARPMVKVRYRGTEFGRRPTGDSNEVVTVTVTDASIAETIGTIVAEDGTELPWGVRARNLTYLAESPYTFLSEGDRYVAWADVLIGAFAPDTPTRHRALVRLEDIGPASDPVLLRRSIDVLVERAVPFTMAVYPLYADPRGVHGRAYGSKGTRALRLDQRPELVEVIRYGLDHGGTIVSHGLTHQYAAAANPYDGVSANDFEFYRAVVDPATDDVVLQGPVAEDSEAWAEARIRRARDLLADAGLPLSKVTMFEVPHYAGSEATYRAIGTVYGDAAPGRPPTRFERGLYGTVGQFFPYPVIDVFGHLVVPENLGNVIEVGYNNNEPRAPADIVANARRHLAVRDSVVGFFFHPYLDADLLAETVDGIADAGFEFVDSTSVTVGWAG